MSDITDTVQEAVEKGGEDGLNGRIALFVAVIATFMALSNVKSGNIGQAMQQAQADSVNLWGYYQSKSTKQNIAESTVEILKVQLDASAGLTPDQRAALEAKIAHEQSEVARYDDEKKKIKSDAEEAGKRYEALNVHDDQLDLADACLSVSVALAGITALTRIRWLFWMAFAVGSVGILFGLAGFFRWQLHSDFMAKLLG